MQVMNAAAAAIDPTTSTATQKSTDSAVGGLANETTFLHLLVAQIQNQDPLNPTDSVQFVGQIVQFSQLEQLLGIHSGIQALLEKASSSGGGTPQAETDNGARAVTIQG